jgi:hypothetical protein
VQSLINNNFTATYTGPARVTHANSTSVNREMGEVTLNIQFASGNISGAITTPYTNMQIAASGNVTSSGFNAVVTQINTQAPDAGSVVSGIFCGPGADTVIGMARAAKGSDRYHATFIGRR